MNRHRLFVLSVFTAVLVLSGVAWPASARPSPIVPGAFCESRFDETDHQYITGAVVAGAQSNGAEFSCAFPGGNRSFYTLNSAAITLANVSTSATVVFCVEWHYFSTLGTQYTCTSPQVVPSTVVPARVAFTGLDAFVSCLPDGGACSTPCCQPAQLSEWGEADPAMFFFATLPAGAEVISYEAYSF